MKPSLACDSRIFMVDQYSPDELDVRELATSDSEMTFSQNFVTRSFLKIGSYDIINVTAKNNFGTESYCSLLVHFKGLYFNLFQTNEIFNAMLNNAFHTSKYPHWQIKTIAKSLLKVHQMGKQDKRNY